ncbi:splicing factor [Tothia fuscella]|uniref:LSM2-LSM8 complex subunit LSM8 n=1 Tax=Tothia fuscella TaxID=1048955 RepID=A0A9P4P258_9PEZI|nr:splicing factor [Tothia fuscella]
MSQYFGPLKDYVNSLIRVITTDGRTLQGTLLAIDNQTNLILTDTIERTIQEHDSDAPNEIRELGILLLRGDLVLICGEVDEEMDDEINWMAVKGDTIGSTKHV